MKKIAMVFPGQGSQSAGMGRDLYEKSPAARATLDEVAKAVDTDLKKLCFEGPDPELTLSHNAQPAVTAVNLMALAALREAGLEPTAVAGHSLGEYSACVAAGVIGASDAVRITRRRGELMQACADKNPGAMAAVMGVDFKTLKMVCGNASNGEVCQVANFNSPGQIVISGNSGAIDRAEILSKQAGAKRFIRLPVSGPWHSPLMANAREQLAVYFGEFTFVDPKITLVQNVTGAVASAAAEIRDNLVAQVTDPVLWVDCVNALKALGCEVLIEVGPGGVLAGLCRKIDSGLTIIGVSDTESLAAAIDKAGN